MGLDPLKNEVEVSIAVWRSGAPTWATRPTGAASARVSSWRRIPSDALIPHAKASGQYLNSVLARIEATKAGYDESILLDMKGDVCEGTGENVFVVYGGSIATPPQSADIDGITRKSVMQIARDLGYEVQERDVARARARARRRGLPHGDRRRAHAGARDRRPPAGRARPGDPGDPGGLPRRPARQVDRYRDWLDLVPVPSKA